MRLSEIAQRVAPYLNRDTDAVHTALRNPHIKNHLQGTPGATPKSPVDYDFPEVVRAFILLSAQASNIDGAELGKISAALNERSASLMDKPGGATPHALDEMIRSISAGREDWHLFVRFIISTAGSREIAARLGRGNMTVNAQRAANAERTTRGDITVSHAFIPLADLLKPLLKIEG